MLLVALIGCALSASSAFAQTATPPVAESSTDVPYPSGAEGDAVVVLELMVEKDGSVSTVEVIEGQEPFAEHARTAALAWKFRPAERDGVATAARVRARVEFRKPVEDTPEVQEVQDGGAASPAPTAAAPPEKPVEVNVQGKRREIGQTTMTAADVEQMPGAFGDAFRAVEALPGVTPTMSGLPYFFVRGAPPNNNGYFLDGIRVPFLFHIGLGPGVIHPGLLDRVDFYPGGAPASYGGFTGGIIAGQTREPALRAHGAASVRLVDAGALVESPFGNGRGSALVAGRYGYPGPILSAFSEIRLGYWDYQSRVTWQLGNHDTIGLFAFGGHDYLAHVEPDSGATVEDLVSDFHRLDLRHDHVWRDGRVRVAATLGYDLAGSDPTYLTNKSAAVRLEAEQQLSSTLRARVGADARIERYGFRREAPPESNREVVPSNADPPRLNVTTASWADVVWRMAPRVEIVPGMRLTMFDSARESSEVGAPRVRTTVPALDPRLGTRVVLAPKLAWLSNLGLAHQYPVLRVGGLPAPVAAGAGFPEGVSQLQTTLHQSQGIELGLPEEIVLTVTGFSAQSWGITDLTASCVQIEQPSGPVGPAPPPISPYYCPSNSPVKGHAHGIELLVRRPLSKRLGGWISYTLSRSVREAHFLDFDGSEHVVTVPSEFDRTHVLNAVVAYDLGRRWRVGTRFVLYSGAPYSRLSGSLPVPPYNSERDPPFFRADLRLEKRWRLGKEAFLTFVFEVQNATLSKETNTLGMDCEGNGDENGYTTECRRGTVGPITIPSVGLEAVF